jgi:hypothetical protein
MGELIVVKVQDKEIKMPKLDIDRALKLGGPPNEVYKNNIKNQIISQTSNDSSSSVESSVPLA